MAQLLLALSFAAAATCAGNAADPYGGSPDVRGKATGFFHVEQLDGVWWLITPEGNAFFSRGVNCVLYNIAYGRKPSLGYAPYQSVLETKYGAVDKWAEASVARLREWGFNTIGAWSSIETHKLQMPYVYLADLAASAGAEWQHGKVADVFAPAFEQAVRTQARKMCAPRVRDPFLIGYFTDNELHWGADWRSKKSLFEEFFGQPADTPGKQAAVRVLRARWTDAEAFNRAWGTSLQSLDELPSLTSLPAAGAAQGAATVARGDFLGEYARTYFKTCHDAIRAVDPNHLILGCRFAGAAPPATLDALKEFVDVVSFNNYGPDAPVDALRRLHDATGRPIMLTEFSFKAADSGLPNTKGGGKPVATQQDRADCFERYVTALAQTPFVLGYHWFCWADEPASGRFDGENNNYGLVNANDEPWAILVERMTRVNACLVQVHRESAQASKDATAARRQ